MKSLKLISPKATAYDFNCFGCEKYYINDENCLTLSKQNNIYCIFGFINNKHVSEGFETLRDSRKFIKSFKFD